MCQYKIWRLRDFAHQKQKKMMLIFFGGGGNMGKPEIHFFQNAHDDSVGGFRDQELANIAWSWDVIGDERLQPFLEAG